MDTPLAYYMQTYPARGEKAKHVDLQNEELFSMLKQMFCYTGCYYKSSNGVTLQAFFMTINVNSV